MTREEEISNAIDAIFPIPPSGRGRKYEQALMATGFGCGVKWADAHPKSPWISVKDDLPCNHEELICENGSDTKRVIVIESGGYHFDLMTLSNNGKWKWLYSFHPTHWMPIPEPPKE